MLPQYSDLNKLFILFMKYSLIYNFNVNIEINELLSNKYLLLLWSIMDRIFLI